MTIDLSAMKEDSINIIQNTIFSVNTDLEWNEFKKSVKALCVNFLTVASANLLVDLDRDLFFLNLCRSSENWRRLMMLASTHYKQPVSLFYEDPIHAAVVSGDKQQIFKLKEVMPKTWTEGDEYQDRFCINWLLVLLSLNGCKSDTQVDQYLDQLVDANQNGQRSTLVNTLLEKENYSQDSFWDTFETLLNQYKEEIEEKATSGVGIEKLAAHRYIWFEGLAWLRLAQIKKFRFPMTAFQFCPDEALEAMTKPYQGDWIILPDMRL